MTEDGSKEWAVIIDHFGDMVAIANKMFRKFVGFKFADSKQLENGTVELTIVVPKNMLREGNIGQELKKIVRELEESE